MPLFEAPGTPGPDNVSGSVREDRRTGRAANAKPAAE